MVLASSISQASRPGRMPVAYAGDENVEHEKRKRRYCDFRCAESQGTRKHHLREHRLGELIEPWNLRSRRQPKPPFQCAG
jgi:hypothetical protein